MLAGVRLTADDAHLTVAAFDYDVSATVVLDAAVTTPGEMLLHGALLHDLIKNARGRDVTIRAEGSKAIITPGPSRFELQTLPVEDYPALPTFPTGGGTVYVQQFIAAVKKVYTATGVDDTIPMLTGIRIEFDGDRMVLVSTDRFRLATTELTWFPDNPGAEHPPMLIPGRLLKLIATRWGKTTGRLRISLDSGTGDGVAGLALNQDTFTCRLLFGEFVRYKSLFPKQYLTAAVVETKALHEAARLVGLVADRTSPIRLDFAPGQITLSAGAGDEAQGTETVPAVYSGEHMAVSFNPSFLLDGLSVAGQGFIKLSFTTPAKPAVLTAHTDPAATDADGFRYLMMPLRVPGQQTADPATPEPPTQAQAEAEAAADLVAVAA